MIDEDIQAGGPGLSFEESVATYPESAAKALREMAAQLTGALSQLSASEAEVADGDKRIDRLETENCELRAEVARLRREVEALQRGQDQMRLLAGLPLPPHIVTELKDIYCLDEAACRYGTRLDIPAKLPGFDPGDGSDHLHFVLMPIGARSRRAAVEYLEKKEKVDE